MMKRANKITALVVAAASIMSVVPAMAATKLGTKDGTIDRGVAFKDGKYLYEGYRTDDDDKGIYYNAGDKDKKLDDATEIDTAYGKYGKDQVAVQDGNDKYMVDLSTGKITDDDTAEDLTTTAQAKLETKLAKTQRHGYGSNTNGPVIKSITSEQENLKDVDKTGDRFGDVWYAYAATSKAGVTADLTTATTTNAEATYTGYTNQSGAYIDCSKNANIYVFNGYKMVKIENLGDTVAKGTDAGANDVTLNSIRYIKTLGQDEKYLYRLVQVDVTNAKLVTDPSRDAGLLYYVEKISKAQGDKEKDAYLPKTTESFLIDVKAVTGDGDNSDAYNALITPAEDSANALANDLSPATYIVDGSIYTTFWEDNGYEKVKTIKVNLKTSVKLDRYAYDNSGVVYKKTNDSSSKIDSHIAVKDTDKDTKANDWSVDVNGNVWAIYDGEIKESTKMADFKTVYTCDRSLDRVDVYDENNLLAWDNSGDVYTNVAEGQAQAKADAGSLVTPAKVGWEQLSDGTWTFYDATGAKVVNNWANIGGVWYFLDVNGTMATGWQQVNGSWYYLNPISDGTKGAMKTGWLNDNGTWYFLNSSGAMETGWKNINGSWYYLNPISDGTRGAMKTGWVNDNGTWYYLYSNGSMASNTIINGYKLSSNGALI